MADEEIPLQLDTPYRGKLSKFGRELNCRLCGLVIYIKTGDYMTYTISHDCSGPTWTTRLAEDTSKFGV